MSIPWTLQRYIFREMGKTFLLTAAALTATMSLGGGVVKMIGIGELTPQQLLWLLVLIVPVSAALTLPVAALFSAAATYGRLAADNEFVACRSSGINIHVLFLPTLALSVFSAGVTFGFWNYAIPEVIQHLDKLVTADPGSLIRQRLHKPRGLALGRGLRLSADELHTDPEDPTRLVLTDVVFVEMDGDVWSRYGAARELHIHVDLEASPAMVSARLVGVSFYDRSAHRFVDLAEQIIPSTELPAMLPQRIKYLNMSSLLYYARHLDEWHQVRKAMDDLRVQVGRRMANDWVERGFRETHSVHFGDARYAVTVRADKPAARIPRDGGVELTEATLEERRGGRLRTATAARTTIEVVRADTLDGCRVMIHMYDVQITVDGQTIARAKETFGPIALPHDVLARVGGLSAARLFDPIEARDDRDPVVAKQAQARVQRTRILYDIIGTINERVAFSVSVFVLVVLAAALGIVFRGSHTVVAFGISFVPALLVIVTIVMGKQMTQNAGTHWIGLGVLWGGIALVAALDWWALFRLVRR